MPVNGDEPATKRDIEQLRSDQHHIHEDLVERINDSETRVLQAIYAYADAANKRLAQEESATAAVNGRLSNLEGRVMELEKRLNMPPPRP